MTWPFGSNKQHVVTRTFDQHRNSGDPIMAQFAGVDARMHRKQDGLLVPEFALADNFKDKYGAFCTNLISKADPRRVHQFAHLEEWLFKDGDTIKEGQKFAIPGKTGYVTTKYDNLTHYAILLDKVRVDPIAFHKNFEAPATPPTTSPSTQKYKLTARVHLLTKAGNGRSILIVPVGAIITRLNNSVIKSHGYSWYNVSYGKYQGWMAINWMKPITAPSGQKYKLTARVHLLTRAGNGESILIVPVGAVVTRLDNSVVKSHGYDWYYVQYGSYKGWMAINWFQKV